MANEQLSVVDRIARPILDEAAHQILRKAVPPTVDAPEVVVSVTIRDGAGRLRMFTSDTASRP